MIKPVILSGGGGTRLWPLSRTHFPKQYWALTSEKTLLQEAALRVNHTLFSAPLVICNHEHRFLVAEQLREIDITPSDILLETASNNTAPAIAIACLIETNPDTLMLVLPADHRIENQEAFQAAIQSVLPDASQDKIVTFGIETNAPETRYGYIEAGNLLSTTSTAFEIARFIEKPDLETAKILVQNKQCFWNSGLFLFKVSTMLKELERLCPTLLNDCRHALADAKKDLDFLRINSDLIHSSTSIDYAVMEHTPYAAVVPVQMGWSDVGTWDSLWKISNKNTEGNVLMGDVLVEDVQNSYIQSENQLLSVIGLDNIVVVATEDAILISHQESLAKIQPLIQKLKEQNRKELISHKKVYRPWGYYQSMDLGSRFQVKRIMVKPGAKTSTQIHCHRSEHWVVVEGIAKVTRGDEIVIIHENESIYLPMGTKHAVENPGKIPLHLIEVQTGSYLGEDDIIRLEDAYGRAEAVKSAVSVSE